MALDPEEEQVEYWADYVAGGGDITRIPSNLRQAVVEYSQSGDWLDADLEGFEDDIEVQRFLHLTFQVAAWKPGKD